MKLKALALCALIASRSMAADDAPRIIKLEDGNYLVNPAAFSALDMEMKRLQGVERLHKDEKWVPILLVGVGIGLTAGLATGVVVWLLPRPN